MDVKTCQYYWKKKKQINIKTLIDDKNNVKMFKTLQWNHQLAARGSTLSFGYFDVIFVVDKSVDHEKVLSICW